MNSHKDTGKTGLGNAINAHIRVGVIPRSSTGRILVTRNPHQYLCALPISNSLLKSAGVKRCDFEEQLIFIHSIKSILSEMFLIKCGNHKDRYPGI